MARIEAGWLGSRRRSSGKTRRHRAEVLAAAVARPVMLELLEARQLLSETIHWTFDEGTSPVQDVSVNASAEDTDFYTGDVYGEAEWVAGKSGKAIKLNGTNSYVLGYSQMLGLLGGTVTLATWIKTTQVGSDTQTRTPGIFGGDDLSGTDDLFWGILDGSGRIGLGVGNQQIKSVNPINDGQWHHVAMTRNADTGDVQLYVDGILSNSGRLATGPKGISGQSLVGMARNSDGSFEGYLDATLDDFFVYSQRTLSSSEVAKLFDPTGQVPAAPTNLRTDLTGTTAVKLSWDDTAENDSGYEIERSSTGAAGSFTKVGSVGAVGSYVDRGLTPNTTYYYRVRAFNPTGNSDYSNVLTVKTVAIATPGSGTGLYGIYYDEGGVAIDGSSPEVVNPESNFHGRVFTQTDETVNFNWGTAAPFAEMGADNFSVRWMGQIQPMYTEYYTFYSMTDDGAALYIDGQLVIDDPTYHGATAANEKSSETLVPGGILLQAGQKYSIVFESFDRTGDAAAMLRWESLSTPKQIIPKTQLYLPTQTAKPGTAASGLQTQAAGPFAIQLTWTDRSSNEVGYRILRSSTQAGTFAEIAQVASESYTDRVYPGQTWYYKVVPFNLAGDGPASTVVNAQSDPLPDVQPGLLGTYYPNLTLDGIPVVVRAEGDYTWNSAATGNVEQIGVINWPDIDNSAESPLYTGDSNIDDGETFSIRWEGTFTPTTTGPHTFFTRTDDAVRLYVNGQLLVAMPDANNFSTGRGVPAVPGDAGGPITLTAGVAYPIVMEYNQGTGGAVAELRWQGPGMTAPQMLQTTFNGKQVLSSAVTVPTAATGLTGTPGAVTLTLKWNDTAKNEFSNVVQMSSDGGATWRTLTRQGAISNLNGGAGTGTYFVTGLKPSTAYSFRIVESNSAGEAISNIYTVTTNAPANPNGNAAASSGDTNLSSEGSGTWSHWGQGHDIDTWNSPGGASSLISAVTVSGGDAAITNANGITAQRENDLGGAIVPFGEDVFCYMNRNHQYNGVRFTAGGVLTATDPALPDDITVGIPSYLLGGEYVSTLNDNRDNASFAMNVTVTKNVRAYLLLDNRIGDSTNTNPPTLGNGIMDWVAADGWTVVNTGISPNGQPDFVACDEGATITDFLTRATTTTSLGVGAGVGINNFFTVYAKDFAAGDVISLKQQNNGGLNMYGLVVQARETTNITPIGNGTVQAADTPGKTFTWTGGFPTGSATATDDAIAVSGAGNGFRFTVPASTVLRRLKVYVGAENTTGQLTATLSDGSVLPYTATLDATNQGLKTAVYTIEYRAELANQTLTIDWTATKDGGRVILSASTLSDVAPPTAPTNLDAQQIAGDGIKLTWTDTANNETQYKIERKMGANGTYQQIAVLGANATTYTDNDLALVPTTEYFYRVRATGAAGDSGYSNEDSAIADLPAAPSLAAGPDDSQVHLRWSNKPGLTYTVKQSQTPGGPYTVVATGLTGSTYDTPARNRTTYYYVVSAVKNGFEGPNSAEASVMPSAVEQFIKINFTNDTDDTREDQQSNPAGYKFDYGYDLGYEGEDSVTGPIQQYSIDDITYHYGWGLMTDTDGDGVVDTFVPTSNTANARDRDSANSNSDERLDSFNHMQKGGANPDCWEIEVPNGEYRVLVGSGDPDNVDSYFAINVEGVLAVRGQPTTDNRFILGVDDSGLFVNVKVTDGRLTITNNTAEQAKYNAATGTTATNNKIDFIDIYKILTVVPTPNVPTGLVADPAAPSGAKLTWTDNANNELGYRIERKAAGGTFQEIGTVAANVTSYADKDPSLVPGTQYIYRVRAYNSAGESEYSNEDGAVIFLQATGAGQDGGVSLSWTPAVGENVVYTITRTQFDPTTGAVVDGSETRVATGITGTQYLDKKDTEVGVDYFYTVSASNGAASAPVLVTAMQGKPLARINFTIAAGADYAGYFKDVGLAYGTQNGLEYGWLGGANNDNRDRNRTTAPLSIDERYDSLTHLQKASATGRIWEISVPNGTYYVHVVGGDPNSVDSNIGFMFEAGTANQVVTGLVPIRTDSTVTDPALVPFAFAEFYVVVEVTDGKLTVQSDTVSPKPDPDPNTGTNGNNKIAYIDINGLNVSTPLSVTGTANADTFYVKLDGSDVKVFNAPDGAGTPIATKPLAMMSSFSIAGADGDDKVIVDFSGGNPLPASGLTLDGGAGADSLTVKGSNAGQAISINGTKVMFGAAPINLTGLENVIVDSINGSALALSGTAAVTLPAGGNKVLKLAGLSFADNATLDLADNDLIVSATPETKQAVLAAIANAIKAARGDGSWA
ncbi:MAG: PA14 domain-containing protein, partial [Bacillota bacterium]